ncbi:MAG: tetratricopeptide repeat protein [Melioribacteraceae bacterium]|nr:tetratricopeptide repeat protein [Melioribacteraceae bacterium]
MNLKKCNICGEELSGSEKFCPACGANLGNKELNEQGTENYNEKRTKSSQQKNNTREIKSISPLQIIYLSIFLAIIGLIIIYSAGVFETSVGVNNTIENKADPHAGVDLTNLKEINRLEDIIKNNPNDKATLEHLAHLLNDSGFKERAIEKYKQYLKIDPKNADVIVDMGVCYFELGDYEEAIKLMEKSLEYVPKHQIAHLNLGVVNMNAGNMTVAKKWLQKAYEINPNNDVGKRAQELLKSH